MGEERGPIRIRLLLFARAHELAGASQLDVELPGPTTVAALDAELRRRFDWLGSRLSTYRLAVDHEFASPEDRVDNGAEVAIIPPVSGG